MKLFWKAHHHVTSRQRVREKITGNIPSATHLIPSLILTYYHLYCVQYYNCAHIIISGRYAPYPALHGQVT